MKFDETGEHEKHSGLIDETRHNIHHGFHSKTEWRKWQEKQILKIKWKIARKRKREKNNEQTNKLMVSAIVSEFCIEKFDDECVGEWVRECVCDSDCWPRFELISQKKKPTTHWILMNPMEWNHVMDSKRNIIDHTFSIGNISITCIWTVCWWCLPVVCVIGSHGGWVVWISRCNIDHFIITGQW